MSKPNKNTGANDDPRSAPESGDPKDTGRNRGQVVEPEIRQDARDRSGEADESGRHQAAPRSGD